MPTVPSNPIWNGTKTIAIAGKMTSNINYKMKQPTQFLTLKKLLLDSPLTTEYQCIYIDEFCVIFDATSKTAKVMIPTDLILEWINAFEFKLISENLNAREMREAVKTHSQWAPYQHGFETHLCAIIKKWANLKTIV